MEELLAEATGPLCFIVVIPTWSPENNRRAIQSASKQSWVM